MEHKVKTEILMNVTPHETRVTIVEDGIFQEVHFERENQRGIVGNIYKGKVIRVLPGMQAAFVDIGLDRAGFLHVSDIMPLLSENSEPVDYNSAGAEVRKWVREGQEILVQVAKDPLGTKGARLTAHLSIASRHLVHMPDMKHLGVSCRIEGEEIREVLKEKMKAALEIDKPKGYIVRTVAENVSVSILKEDVIFLTKLRESIIKKSKTIKCPGLIYEDLRLPVRTLRDLVDDSVDRVRVDNIKTYQELLGFSKSFIPNVYNKLDYYDSENPIFDMYGIEDDLDKALGKRVPLKSGGYLLIEQTEAMVTIDINTGAYVGLVNLEETIFKTNLEAAKAIGRQLRLRNLGGIIIIDFIDMMDDDHKQQVLNQLKGVLERDSARTNISGFSDLGLVEMSRKRTQESLVQYLCDDCSYCGGFGKMKSMQTICYEIFREIQHEAKAYSANGFLVVGSSILIELLMNEESIALSELEVSIQKPIKLKSEPSYSRELYDIVLM